MYLFKLKFNSDVVLHFAGLSTGVIIGIVMGVLIGIALIIIIVCCCCALYHNKSDPRTPARIVVSEYSNQFL